MLCISLIAASVYLRWREQIQSTDSKELQDDAKKKRSVSNYPADLQLSGNFHLQKVFLSNWIRAEQTFVIEKFKRSQLLVKTVKRQHAAAASVEDESQSDVVPSTESDSGIVCLQPQGPEASEEGIAIHGSLNCVCVLMFVCNSDI